MSESTLLRSNFYEIVAPAVRDGLAHAHDVSERKVYIGTHLHFPEFSHFSSGFPHITFALFNGPIDYKGVFRGKLKPEPLPGSWLNAIKFAVEDEDLRRHYHMPPDRRENEEGVIFQLALEQFIDHYIHCNSLDFDESAFIEIYRQWEAAIFLDELPVDILIPLIGITFDFDELQLGADIRIEKIEKGIQLARAEGGERNAENQMLSGAATHGVVLENWVVRNQPCWDLSSSLNSAQMMREPVKKADLFLASLRVATGVETGYDQIVTRPCGWGERWEANLPCIGVARVRAFPDHFRDGIWHKKPPVIIEDQCLEAYNVFYALEGVSDEGTKASSANKLLLATRRLNMASLRSHEADTILDLTIALESLLADDSKSEIIYRLSLRMGMLARLAPFEDYTPSEVMTACKKVYDYRSVIVHGAVNPEKKRVIQHPRQTEAIPAVELGLRLLRWAIKALLSRPHLLEVKNLDESFLNDDFSPEIN